MKNIYFDILNAFAQSIYDKNGFNILVLDIRETSSMTDFIVIAEGHVDRHVKTLCYAVVEKAKELGYHPWHIDGEPYGDWIVIDFGNIMVHLFTPELREKYALEKLWMNGSIVDVTLVSTDRGMI